MNARFIALIAAACMSSIAVAQTTGTQGQTTGTGTTGTNTTQPTDRNAANSGEQNSATMQNNSTKQSKSSKDRRAHKNNKTKADCNDAHTDGNATTPATARADCDNTTKTQQR